MIPSQNQSERTGASVTEFKRIRQYDIIGQFDCQTI